MMMGHLSRPVGQPNDVWSAVVYGAGLAQLAEAKGHSHSPRPPTQLRVVLHSGERLLNLMKPTCNPMSSARRGNGGAVVRFIRKADALIDKATANQCSQAVTYYSAGHI